MLLVATRIALSPIHGIGVFALAPIAMGTPVWRFTPGLDQEFSPEIVEGLPEHMQAFFSHYGYIDRNLRRLVLCFDHARFMNHSDDPNIGSDGSEDPYGVDVAIRAIAAGEEITTDYTSFEDAPPPG